MFYVYILANQTDRVLYIGVTGDLAKRLREHRNGEDGFTRRYRVHKLVYVESYADPQDAIRREKQLKRWRRDKKETLIRSANPQFEDCAERYM